MGSQDQCLGLREDATVATEPLGRSKSEPVAERRTKAGTAKDAAEATVPLALARSKSGRPEPGNYLLQTKTALHEDVYGLEGSLQLADNAKLLLDGHETQQGPLLDRIRRKVNEAKAQMKIAATLLLEAFDMIAKKKGCKRRPRKTVEKCESRIARFDRLQPVRAGGRFRLEVAVH